MQKIIIIGETALDIGFPAEAEWPLRLEATPAGPLLNAAAALAGQGHSVAFVSDAGRDFVGQLLVDYLASHSVDTGCIDRFAAEGGFTPAYFRSENATVPYRNYPGGERFNVMWPRIDHGDIVVFGGYFAVSPRTSQQVAEILGYARQMKAVIVYAPGFNPVLEPQITRVMPAVLDNLEVADIVLTRSADLSYIFNESDSARCYTNRIGFYCPTMVNLDTETGDIEVFHRRESVRTPYSAPGIPSLTVRTRAVAAVVNFLMNAGSDEEPGHNLTSESLHALADAVSHGITESPTDSEKQP